jgi:hypothetical protein
VAIGPAYFEVAILHLVDPGDSGCEDRGWVRMRIGTSKDRYFKGPETKRR